MLQQISNKAEHKKINREFPRAGDFISPGLDFHFPRVGISLRGFVSPGLGIIAKYYILLLFSYFPRGGDFHFPRGGEFHFPGLGISFPWGGGFTLKAIVRRCSSWAWHVNNHYIINKYF